MIILFGAAAATVLGRRRFAAGQKRAA